MAKLKALPRSRAKTAYGLVSDVIRAVLDEPKRADMGTFIGSLPPEIGGPACGTVGCFAGWVAILGRRQGETPPTYHQCRGNATNLLGNDINYHTATGGSDDYPDDENYVFNGGGPDIKGNAGTVRYARSVAARIRKFQKINAVALKAKRLA